MATKCMSLVEQKRLQWAKEKEEMAGMCAPWGPSPNFRDSYRSSIRTQFVSTNQVTLSLDTLDSKVDLSLHKVRRRSPNLPPIHNNINQ
ncbi:unnamed protein product, partial [Timema podura]|nr:unnamed protein product [Timema podura]